jgi:hypothetical protein
MFDQPLLQRLKLKWDDDNDMMGTTLKILSPKLSLAVGCCFLVASIFAPLEMYFMELLIFVDPGPYTGPPLARRVVSWSFMSVVESLTKINDTWVVTHVYWQFFRDRWGPSFLDPHTSILLAMFTLQIVAVLLGVVTLRIALAAEKILLLLLMSLVLIGLHFAYTHVSFSGAPYLSFWLSLLATAAILTALVTATVKSTAMTPPPPATSKAGV